MKVEGFNFSLNFLNCLSENNHRNLRASGALDILETPLRKSSSRRISMISSDSPQLYGSVGRLQRIYSRREGLGSNLRR